MLRSGGVLASRLELQDKGVLQVCRLGQPASGGRLRHLLRVRECEHRCEAARTGAVPRPLPRACIGADACTSTPSYPRTRSLCVHHRVHGGECLLHQNEETPEAAAAAGCARAR